MLFLCASRAAPARLPPASTSLKPAGMKLSVRLPPELPTWAGAALPAGTAGWRRRERRCHIRNAPTIATARRE